MLKLSALVLALLLPGAARAALRDVDKKLFGAIEDGTAADVRKLLDAGANISAVDGRTTVLIQAMYNRANGPEIVKLLVDSGADPDPNEPNPAQETLYAFGMHKILRALLEAGANPAGPQNEGGRTSLLAYAAKNCRSNEVAVLLELGADPNEPTGIIPMTARQHLANDAHYRARCPQLLAMLEKAEKEGARPRVPLRRKPALLQRGSIQDEGELDKRLMARVMMGRPEEVTNLIDVGASVMATGKNGSGLLALASCNWYHGADIARILLAKGAPIDFGHAGSRRKENAVKVAVRNVHAGVLRALLEAGADPGNVPADAQEWGCSLEIARLLLDFGADPRPKEYVSPCGARWQCNSVEMTPREGAAIRKCGVEVEELLASAERNGPKHRRVGKRPGQSKETAEVRLSEVLAALKKEPASLSLRMEAIGIALSMKTAPAVPEGARIALEKAREALEAASTPRDFGPALAALKEALIAAPWLAGAYYNQAAVQRLAEMYKEAAESYRMYLAGAPNAADAADVQEAIKQVESRIDAPSEEEAAKGAFLKAIEGGVWRWVPARGITCQASYVSVKSQQIYDYSQVEVLDKSNCPIGVTLGEQIHNKPARGSSIYSRFVHGPRVSLDLDWGSGTKNPCVYQFSSDLRSVTRSCRESANIWTYERVK